MQVIRQKKDWLLTQDAFRRLQDWLDGGVDSEGQRYLEMRERLVAYFDRKNCSDADELADETLNRVARRLEEEGHIESETPAKYCYIVARFVFMEYLRGAHKENSFQDDLRRESLDRNAHGFALDQENAIKETMLDCLDRCTENLPSANRRIILRYYIGKERVKIENRRALAAEFGVSMNALSIRACRIRNKLEGCVKECAAEK